MMRAADLQPRDKVGQLLWIGFEGIAWEPALEGLIDRVRPGGVILFARNIVSARQVRSLTDALYRALPIPPFIALDQEGGRVNRLKTILGPSSASYSLGRRADATTAVTRHAAATARALRNLGFNVNLAPVLDLSGPDPANGIGDRAFAEDPRRVANLAASFAKAHLRAGVLPVGKHFPGLGAARADTHLTLPAIPRSRSALWDSDLLPYRRLRRILPIIMVGHAYYPSLQGARAIPATLSREVIAGLLRRRIGYRGLVVTDDLEMGAVDQGLDVGEVAVRALEVGSDGLMFCRTEAKILEASEGIARALAVGRIGRSDLAASLRRILVLKNRHLARRRPAYSAQSLDRSRLVLASLGEPSEAGPDPTARP
jgi:beta-N-acetylhexosaminidase